MSKVWTTTLERVLIPERERRRSGASGFALPAMGERPGDPDWDPLLVTNMRRSLVPTRLSKDQSVRFGFSAVLLEEEPLLLSTLSGILTSRGQDFGDVSSAVQWMQNQGVHPHHLVLPYSSVSKACGGVVSEEDARTIMSSQGYISKIADDVLVLADDIPTGILVGHPSLAGFYIRSDDRLALVLTRISSSWCTVSL